MREALVALERVELRRRGRRILGPLDLSISRGELVALVGPNGAGKSTLLALLAGVLPPSDGRREALLPPRQLAGVLLQHHDFAPEVPLGVEDVVLFGRSPHLGLFRRPSGADREAARRALAALGLESERGKLYRELSGGNRRKVQLARLIAQEAPLVLLDEPAAGLDLDWQERLVGLVAGLAADAARAVVLVTHQVDLVPAEATRVVLLAEGRVVADAPPREALAPAHLAKLWGCPVEVSWQAGRPRALLRPAGGSR